MGEIYLHVDVYAVRDKLMAEGKNVVQKIWANRKDACINALGEVLDENGYLPHGTTWDVYGDTCWFSVTKKDGHELAGYFHEGEIYGPNFLIERGKLKGQWRSPKGKPKTPTGRYLSQYPGSPSGVRHWTEKIKEGGPLYDEYTRRCEEILRR